MRSHAELSLCLSLPAAASLMVLDATSQGCGLADVDEVVSPVPTIDDRVDTRAILQMVGFPGRGPRGNPYRQTVG
jgi:hypothetical protein